MKEEKNRTVTGEKRKARRRERYRRYFQNRKQKLLLAGIAAGLLVCLLVIAGYYGKQKKEEAYYEKLRQEALVKEAKKQAEAATADTKEPEEEEPELEIPVDFAALQEQNPDIYAWIQVNGTAISYPVLQSEEDNSYYLNHTVEGEKAIAGSIYTENYNRKDFSDPNTVVYGHNMKNGTMFRELHLYEEKEFFDANREIVIYQPDVVLKYEIFAAYVYNSNHLLFSFDCSTPEGYQAYLDEIRSAAPKTGFLDEEKMPGTEDRLLTLSTCNLGREAERYLVQAVLVEETRRASAE